MAHAGRRRANEDVLPWYRPVDVARTNSETHGGKTMPKREEEIVSTNFVKMMKRKKVARHECFNFDSSVLILLATLHRMVFALFSRSSE